MPNQAFPHHLPWCSPVSFVPAKVPIRTSDREIGSEATRAWQGPLMNRSGHLTLVKSTLTAMPIYLMMCDVLRRNFIWTGKDSHQRQKHSGLAHCLPSDNMGRAGRLGVQDLELAGFALRTRWIWPQRTDEEGAWSCRACVL